MKKKIQIIYISGFIILILLILLLIYINKSLNTNDKYIDKKIPINIYYEDNVNKELSSKIIDELGEENYLKIVKEGINVYNLEQSIASKYNLGISIYSFIDFSNNDKYKSFFDLVITDELLTNNEKKLLYSSVKSDYPDLIKKLGNKGFENLIVDIDFLNYIKSKNINNELRVGGIIMSESIKEQVDKFYDEYKSIFPDKNDEYLYSLAYDEYVKNLVIVEYGCDGLSDDEEIIDCKNNIGE